MSDNPVSVTKQDLSPARGVMMSRTATVDRQVDGWDVAIWGGILGVIAAVLFGWGWYKAGVQQGVYQRQGVQMSRWEVFLGAKPVERYMQPAAAK